jgi:competence protein ComFB
MDLTLLKVENRWQKLVEDVVERFLAEGSFSCSCSKCRTDVAAIALNSLPPDYVPVEYAGELAASGEDLLGRLIQAEEAALKALELVNKAPHHSGASQNALINSNEELVRTVLAEVLEHNQEQTWTKPQLSWALAYSLRELAPKYTTTPKGDAYARVEEIHPSSMAAIYVAVHKALKRVQAEFSTR